MYMRLNGMGDITDATTSSDPMVPDFPMIDAPNVDIAPPQVSNDAYGNYYTGAVSTPTPTADSSGFDWSNLFSNAVKTWGNVQVAGKQAQTAQSAQQYAYASQLAARGYPMSLPANYRLPGSTPLPGQFVQGATPGLSGTAMIGLAALAAGLVYLARS